MNIDKYFHRQYNAKDYNCAHLVVEVWTDLFGPVMGEMLGAYLCGPTQRRSILSRLKLGRWLDKPESPCVVLLQTPGRTAHVGVMLGNRVLHIQDRNRGVQYQPLDVVSYGFKRVRFFTCKN